MKLSDEEKKAKALAKKKKQARDRDLAMFVMAIVMFWAVLKLSELVPPQ